MSHIETCAVLITDLKALRAACVRLGVTFSEGQKTFKAYYPHNACAHAITGIAGTDWEVGLKETPVKKGSAFSPIFDTWGNQGLNIQKKFCKQKADGSYSKNFEELANAYSLEVLKAKARAKGYTCQEKVVGGKLKLTVTLGN